MLSTSLLNKHKTLSLGLIVCTLIVTGILIDALVIIELTAPNVSDYLYLCDINYFRYTITGKYSMFIAVLLFQSSAYLIK